MNTPDPQTLSPTTVLDIHGDPVVRAAGPVTGAISLGYGCLHPPDSPAPVWFLRVQLAPIIPDPGADTAHIAVLDIAGTRVHGGFAYLWLTPGHRPPRTVTDPPDATPRHLVTDPWTPARPALPTAATAALQRCYEAILTHWHTPQRLHRAQLPTTPDIPAAPLATVHLLHRPRR